MKIVCFLAIIVILFACKQKGDDTVLDMKDITPQSQHNYDDTVLTITQEKKDVGFYLPMSDEVGLNIQGYCDYEELLLPDRFAPKNTLKLSLISALDSIRFCHWTFKDSTYTKNAFYNWIDCFGPKCKSIKLGEKTNFQKDNFLLFVTDTSLTYISAKSKLTSEDWMNYFTLKSDIVDWKILIEQGTRAKATWYKVVGRKKEALI